MKISRSKLKEIVKDTVIENNEYEKFFKSALAKSGKAIPDMSDEEKVAFFDKVDGAWNAKGEKREIGEAECEECGDSETTTPFTSDGNQIEETTFTNQTGIKSSITRSNEFKKAVGDMKRIRWAMSDGVKIFNWAGHGLIFTDGKFEMIVDPKKPMQVVGEFGKARNEFKSLVNNKIESMNNLDWGKSTAERNANLDKHKSLKTDKEKDAFLKKLKGESINEAGGYDVTIKQYKKGQFKGHFSLTFNSSKAKAHAKQRGVTGVDGRGDPMLAGKLKDIEKYTKLLKQRGFSIDTYIMESNEKS
jgi:hypothetical protein